MKLWTDDSHLESVVQQEHAPVFGEYSFVERAQAHIAHWYYELRLKFSHEPEKEYSDFHLPNHMQPYASRRASSARYTPVVIDFKTRKRL